MMLSKDGSVFGQLAGQPRDWDDMNDSMMKVFDIVGQSYTFKPGDLESRRGKFPSVACGISYGGGQKVRIPRLERYASHKLTFTWSLLVTSRTTRTTAHYGRPSWTSLRSVAWRILPIVSQRALCSTNLSLTMLQTL